MTDATGGFRATASTIPRGRHHPFGVWNRVLCIVVGLWCAFYAGIAIVGGAGFDSHAYWLTRTGVEYVLNPGQQNAYLYAPAFAQAILPLTLLPWPVFAALWFLAAATTYAWLVAPASPRVRVVLLALCLGDVVYGNVWWLFALALTVGLRRPALWTIPLLLKITPAVGLIWFAVRREWHGLFVALAVAAALVGVSFAIDPHAWSESLGFVRRQGRTTRFEEARLCAGFVVAAYAGLSDRKWLLVPALWLAAPVFSINGLGIAAALPRLLDGRPAPSRVRVAPDVTAARAA